jgi:hypothetical protein
MITETDMATAMVTAITITPEVLGKAKGDPLGIAFQFSRLALA